MREDYLVLTNLIKHFGKGSQRITAVDNVNIKVKEGELVTLLGPSGCGKTTLVKLLYRLYDIDKGQILIDGEDIRNVKQESLREEMSMVPQECILFDDTIHNNILFSNPKASRRQVMRAMRFAQLDKIIKDFPKKENTIVGERGIKLSGGEKQRLAIARALCHRPEIIVADEPTGNLDLYNTFEIITLLKKINQLGTTLVLCTHNKEVIDRLGKRVITLQEGRVIHDLQRGKFIL